MQDIIQRNISDARKEEIPAEISNKKQLESLQQKERSVNPVLSEASSRQRGTSPDRDSGDGRSIA
ncbi:hypothetical protein SLEP1_g41338 [Rubroshorea leprosula]|uniref:Uncharacterized protein n=1 Tax=Rubroshorea leprosula TaxID=152421 RepID=A0AAV5L766_9ROSI|nr:hypothetical protein SLEP1_g41338 [Rubroshorea leprosula]